MDWKLAMEAEQAMLMRIVALLLSLADLTERTCGWSRALRGFLLWLLRPAEAAVRNMVTGEPARSPLLHAGSSPADAMRLARDFRDLAQELEAQAALAFSPSDDAAGQPAWAGWTRRPAGVLAFKDASAFPASAGMRLTHIPDTS